MQSLRRTSWIDNWEFMNDENLMFFVKRNLNDECQI